MKICNLGRKEHVMTKTDIDAIIADLTELYEGFGRADVPADSDMAKYSAKNFEYNLVKHYHITNVKKRDDGYEITLSHINEKSGGLSGTVPAELGFEPKKGMLAIWDGGAHIGANVNLSFYDSQGKALFETRREGLGKWEKVDIRQNTDNALTNNELAKARKKLAGKIDDKLGTNLSDIKLPKTIKNLEAKISKHFDKSGR